MSPVNTIFGLGVALIAIIAIVQLLRSHWQHAAILKRMDQYQIWLTQIRTAPPEEQAAARPLMFEVLMGSNPDMRGPWESIDVPRD